MNKEKMIIRLRSHTHSFRCENRPLVNGKSYEKLVDKDGNSISDRPEYILAHEIAGHAEPRMNNKEGKVKNAVEIENQIRRETNEKERKEEPDHVQ